MNRKFRIKFINSCAAALLLGACQTMPQKTTPTMPSILEALDEVGSAQPAKPAEPPPVVQRALLPPSSGTLENVQPRVPSFDVSVNEAPARQFFMSLVEGTPDNMVVHPEVSGTLTLDLKNVSTEDVMATLRDVYGYEYRYSHGVYQVFPARMRSQVFKVDYLDIQRKGGSRTRVSSGQITQAPDGGSGTGNNSGNRTDSSSGTSPSGNGNENSATSSFSGAQVTTRTETDFWRDLEASLETLIGEDNGRSIISNPLSGTILVRAMPRELLDIENYLKTLQESVNRQVIIEAKIIEVRLNDAFQAGINWNQFIDLKGASREITTGVFGTGLAAPFNNINNADADLLGSVFALDAHIGDFDALLELLKTQGDVQVLSSPRVSTVNNQKAIIKVGNDEYFVTDLDVDTDVADGVSNQSADVTLTPFFSGVALDVTPQIDDDSSITLHVHPAISDVQEDVKDVSISSNNQFSLPLASSTIRETDTIIRARNGQVVVIGGLMQDIVTDDLSSTPFLGDLPMLGHMFRHTRKVSTKTELVILLRPIVVAGNRPWERDIRNATRRFKTIQFSDVP